MTSCVMISDQKRCKEGFERHLHPERFLDLSSLNVLLDENASPAQLSEDLLERRLHDLEDLGVDQSPAYWLTFARLTELALFCGGMYADAGEFSAAGDLLVNPRLVRVYLRGKDQPITKERHLPLTEQFREVSDSSWGVIQWLKHNTLVDVAKEPLLDFLYETLQGSGQFRQTYLDAVDNRMKQIADTIVFLAGGGDHPVHGPCPHGRPATLSEKSFFKSKLCRFGLEHFLQLGRECQQILKEGIIISRYLITPHGQWNLPAPSQKHEDWKGLGT